MDAATERVLEQLRTLCLNGEYLAAKRVYDDASIHSIDLKEEDKEFIALLTKRSAIISSTLISEEGKDWSYGAEASGVTTTYKVEEDGSISVAIRGLISCTCVLVIHLC
jgi:hypothetical protein